MNVAERTERLAAAGLEVLQPWPLADAAVTPPDVAWAAASCGPESGRVDRIVDDSSENRIREGNEAFRQFAHRFNLADDDGVFLLSVEIGEADGYARNQWFAVKLMTQWDIVGTGAGNEVLGYGWAIPEFVTHSVNGREF